MQGLFGYLSGAKNSVTKERWHSAQSDLLQAKGLARRKGYTTVVAYIEKALMWIEGKGQPNGSLAFFNIQKAQDWLIDNGKVKRGGFDAEAIRGDESLRAAIKAEVRHQMESRRRRRKRARRATEYRTIKVNSGGVDGALKLANELAKNGAYNSVAGTTIQANGSFTYGQVETAIRSLMKSGTVLEVALESVQEQSGNQPSILLKDGQEKFRGTYNECLAKLHQLQSQSWDYAMKYGGWKIVPQGQESVSEAGELDTLANWFQTEGPKELNDLAGPDRQDRAVANKMRMIAVKIRRGDKTGANRDLQDLMKVKLPARPEFMVHQAYYLLNKQEAVRFSEAGATWKQVKPHAKIGTSPDAPGWEVMVTGAGRVWTVLWKSPDNQVKKKTVMGSEQDAQAFGDQLFTSGALK